MAKKWWKERSLCEYAKVCPCTTFCKREAAVRHQQMAAREAAKEAAKSAADSVAQVMDDVQPKNKQRWIWTAAVIFVAIIILAGLIIGYLKPGPVAGIILPIGLAMWWILYKLADRFGQLA